jgi:asparagine synthase (glutamine-hydrolysing)
MCGFAAILAGPAVPPVDQTELLRIRDAMVRRGPDGAGLLMAAEGRVGLAHRRLSIIELSEAGAQPMATADGRLAITFNGEIYNFQVLRQELEQAGAIFRSHSDTEVILELYRRHGTDGLARLRGMFAFALWDQARQGMLLARDGYGIKPLYLADDGKTVRAASQVKALLAGGAVDDRPDPAGHAGFFLWGHVPEPFTLYKGIRALAPGSWLWAGLDGGRREGRFFDLEAEMAAPHGRGGDLREALADTMRAHLVADVPVGVFLSAGLDSTTLAALAAEQASAPVRTVTLGFAEYAGTANDEVPLAEAVARHYGTDHATVRVTGQDFAAARAQILEDMDQPSVDGVNTWFVSRAAAGLGLKVALSGLGGDELFGGYPSFQQIPKLVDTLRPLRLLPGLGKAARIVSAPWIAKLAPAKAAGILELGTRYGDAYLLRRGLYMPWELPQIMDPDMARDGWRALAPLAALEATHAAIGPARWKLSALESAWYMRSQLLRDSDWAGMAHSLEIRVPLVDTALLRAARALTPAPTKRDMALCARPALPEAVLNRAKTGFSVPVAKWLGVPSLRGWAGHVHGHFTARG